MSKDLDILKKAYEDVIWMAIRYANGRATYAPSTVRDSIKEFQKVFPEWKPRYDLTLKSDRQMVESETRRTVQGDWLDDLVE
jgi:hypothetical protein